MARNTDPQNLAERIFTGDRSALARGLTLVDRGEAPGRQLASLAWSHPGKAYVIGITGAPGAGKSTLTDQLVKHLRLTQARVAVLAIDPSSPFSGGALLGDSVRMSDHFLDPEVFIRSMASRGALGGLSAAVPEAVRVLDAAGFDWIVLETVGVGQVEVDIAAAADSTVVVTNPGWGDAVQANKAGLLEVADVLVVNKADRPGAADTEADLRGMLHLRPHASGAWVIPVVATSATERTGVETLVGAITDHRNWQLAEDRLVARRRERLGRELERRILEEIADAVHQRMAEIGFMNTVDRVWNRELSPSAAAEELRPSFT